MLPVDGARVHSRTRPALHTRARGGDESFEALTTDELNAKIYDRQRDIIRKFFLDVDKGLADPEVLPKGLTKQTLKAYEQIAENSIKSPTNTIKGLETQLKRRQIIQNLLKQMK